MALNIVEIFQQRIHHEGISRDFLLQAAIEATSFIRFKQLIWEFSFENSILIPPNFMESEGDSS